MNNYGVAPRVAPVAYPEWGSSKGISGTQFGSFNAGNTFIAELSDATGSFASPLVLGQYTGDSYAESNFTGSTVALPVVGPTTQYRARIRTTSPVTVSEPSTPFSYRKLASNINATLNGVSVSAPSNAFPELGGLSSFAYFEPGITVNLPGTLFSGLYARIILSIPITNNTREPREVLNLGQSSPSSSNGVFARFAIQLSDNPAFTGANTIRYMIASGNQLNANSNAQVNITKQGVNLYQMTFSGTLFPAPGGGGTSLPGGFPASIAVANGSTDLCLPVFPDR